MLSRTYSLKFPSLNAAQVAAPFVIEGLDGVMSQAHPASLNIIISKDGDVWLNVFFDGVADLKTFDKLWSNLIDPMRKNFTFTMSIFDGVCLYSFDRSSDDD